MVAQFEIVSGNERVVAGLLHREAPNVSAAFERVLPCESFSVHAKFAGPELIVMVPFFCEPENEIFDVQPGDIGYYPGRQTICIFYGDTEPFGHVSVFAKVTDGLDTLRGWGSEILRTGSVPVTLAAK
ncbi:MAG: cyclophilin-like fold protein [Gaiellales bacterium]